MIKYLKGWGTTEGFYTAVNAAYKNMYGDYQFIHFPYFKTKGEDFLSTQKNLTEVCLEIIPPIKGQNVLEIGCGNGMQGIYIYEKHLPSHYTGIDINASNLVIADEQKKLRNIENMTFTQDNSQVLQSIGDNSIDTVLNIESALHYPDKQAFMKQVFRVLKPGGAFIIADVLSRKTRTFTNWDHKMGHLNWSYDQYKEGFRLSGLQLEKEIDITDKIVKGFKQYDDWFHKTAIKNPVKKWLIKKWAIAIFKFNIKNLETKNCYYLFSGIKPTAN